MSQEKWITAANGRLFAKLWQPSHGQDRSKAPIVLFHDSLGSVQLWRQFPAQLSQATGRSVIAYDRLGFGRSDPNPGTLSPLSFVSEEIAVSFAALREQLELERFIAFGHSIGGAMAVVCAAALPGHCRALVTESAQMFPEERTLEGIRNAKQAFAQAGQLERLRKYHGDKAAWVLSAWVGTWLSDEFRRWNLHETLPRVSCPVLAIHGDNDEYGSITHAERIASLTAGPATKEILPGCGHVPHREHEEVVLAAVRAFLAPLD